jgi:hypothetical protein
LWAWAHNSIISNHPYYYCESTSLYYLLTIGLR